MRGGAQTFRDWLVDQLLASAWTEVALACRTDGEADALAADLWVDFEAIEELRKRAAADQQTHARKSVTGPKTGPGADAVYPQINLEMPASVKKLWLEYAESVHMNGTTALRSLIHEYLLMHDEPQSADTRWVIRDRVHEFEVGKQRLPAVQPSVTPGAIGVLRRRARAFGTGPHLLVRRLVIECLEGRRVVHRATSVQGMFNDPKRYFLPVAPTPISDGPEGSSDES